MAIGFGSNRCLTLSYALHCSSPSISDQREKHCFGLAKSLHDRLGLAMNIMKLLFICSQSRLRSPTAEVVFSEIDGVEAMSAGTNNDAETPVSGDLIAWADVILVMEKAHRNKVSKKFRPLLKDKRLVVLGIPDEYEYMDPELVRILKAKVAYMVRL
ncbi:MAG: low molecular weight protein tyrosine phosphatase family protein [Planctomycetota bacterium]